MSASEEAAYTGAFPIASEATVVERVQFLQKTYLHLAGAILAFVFLEAILLHLPGIDSLVMTVAGTKFGWLVVLAAFIGVSHLANRWARSDASVGKQYLGLSVYVAAQAVIFLPLLWIAANFGGESVIPTAATITLTLFCGLTAIVLVTKKDFSFLGGILSVAGLAAMGFIVCSILFGFNLGNVFTVAMIAFACGYVLYDTSNALHHYRIGQHVAAALALFASVALMFWYVLRLLMSRR